MRKVIRNRVYNTKQAFLIGSHTFQSTVYMLYIKKRVNEYFIHKLNLDSGTETIEPLTFQEAAHTAECMGIEKFNFIDAKEKFNTPNSKIRVNAYLDCDVAEHLKKMALDFGVSVNKMLNITLRHARVFIEDDFKEMESELNGEK